jgi:hypothetical protein
VGEREERCDEKSASDVISVSADMVEWRERGEWPGSAIFLQDSVLRVYKVYGSESEKCRQIEVVS